MCRSQNVHGSGGSGGISLQQTNPHEATPLGSKKKAKAANKAAQEVEPVTTPNGLTNETPGAEGADGEGSEPKAKKKKQQKKRSSASGPGNAEQAETIRGVLG